MVSASRSVDRAGHSRTRPARQLGSLFIDAMVKRRSAWIARPYVMTAADDSSEPGGWSMNG